MDTLVIITIVVIFFWLGALTYYLYRSYLPYQKMVEGTKSKNLSEIFDKLLNNLAVDKKSIEELKAKLDNLSLEVTGHIQKIGILRFNPFADTGGEQSFVLTILDGKDTGIVLTSLHNRGITRWYIKNVKEGKGTEYELSEEELKAIKLAKPAKQKRKQ